VAGGLKDGWLAAGSAALGKQGLDSVEDFKKASVGETKFTDAPHAEWWARLAELKDNGYWNEDINSLDYQQGQDLFVQGKAAMIFGNDTFYPGWLKQVGDDNFGVMRIPVWGKGKLASTTRSPPRAWASPPGAPTQAAADVLMFMHTRTAYAWYADTGVFRPTTASTPR
jgi:ABC-type glycerol-3-phosphate transport system substrate-binding protein